MKCLHSGNEKTAATWLRKGELRYSDGPQAQLEGSSEAGAEGEDAIAEGCESQSDKVVGGDVVAHQNASYDAQNCDDGIGWLHG